MIYLNLPSLPFSYYPYSPHHVIFTVCSTHEYSTKNCGNDSLVGKTVLVKVLNIERGIIFLRPFLWDGAGVMLHLYNGFAQIDLVVFTRRWNRANPCILLWAGCITFLSSLSSTSTNWHFKFTFSLQTLNFPSMKSFSTVSQAKELLNIEPWKMKELGDSFFQLLQNFSTSDFSYNNLIKIRDLFIWEPAQWLVHSLDMVGGQKNHRCLVSGDLSAHLML